jgi:hypothetical protein
LPDAADRIRVDTKPASPKRAKPAPGRRWTRVLWALAPKSRRGFAGAALVAMMIGIIVNAVVLQHGHRVDLPPDTVATASVKPPAPVAAAIPSAPIAAPIPPSRPTPTTVALVHTAKSADPIADLIRGPAPDTRRLVSRAQAALAKLGFSVKSTGAIDSNTRGALAEFQKSRHLPVSAEVTPKLLKTLNAAVAAN